MGRQFSGTEEWGGRASTTREQVSTRQVMAKLPVGPAILQRQRDRADRPVRFISVGNRRSGRQVAAGGILDASETPWVARGFPNRGRPVRTSATLRTPRSRRRRHGHLRGENGRRRGSRGAADREVGFVSSWRTDPNRRLAGAARHEGITTFIVGTWSFTASGHRPIPRDHRRTSWFCEVVFNGP